MPLEVGDEPTTSRRPVGPGELARGRSPSRRGAAGGTTWRVPWRANFCAPLRRLTSLPERCSNRHDRRAKPGDAAQRGPSPNGPDGPPRARLPAQRGRLPNGAKRRRDQAQDVPMRRVPMAAPARRRAVPLARAPGGRTPHPGGREPAQRPAPARAAQDDHAGVRAAPDPGPGGDRTAAGRAVRGGDGWGMARCRVRSHGRANIAPQSVALQGIRVGDCSILNADGVPAWHGFSFAAPIARPARNHSR